MKNLNFIFIWLYFAVWYIYETWTFLHILLFKISYCRMLLSAFKSHCHKVYNLEIKKKSICSFLIKLLLETVTIM